MPTDDWRCLSKVALDIPTRYIQRLRGRHIGTDHLYSDVDWSF
jgi:hypothetical protein